jgi:undecaprenyl phosphate-alpha-L-ara4N flippase subunit ArnF
MRICSRYCEEIALVSCSIVLSAGAQLLMKAGMLALNSLDLNTILTALPVLSMPVLQVLAWILSGLTLYAISMLAWMAVLSRYQLSFAYPLLSLSYVLVYVAAVLWPRLHETVSMPKTIGVVLILAGVYLVTRTRPGVEAGTK